MLERCATPISVRWLEEVSGLMPGSLSVVVSGNNRYALTVRETADDHAVLLGYTSRPALMRGIEVMQDLAAARKRELLPIDLEVMARNTRACF